METKRWGSMKLGTHCKRMCLLAFMTFAISACTMTETQQRTGTGAAIGAAGGAIAGGLIGGSNRAALGGALIGAVAGAGSGYVVDQRKKREEAEAEKRRIGSELRMPSYARNSNDSRAAYYTCTRGASVLITNNLPVGPDGVAYMKKGGT